MAGAAYTGSERRVDWNVAMADATFVAAKKGGCLALINVGKGSKLMLVGEGEGLTAQQRHTPGFSFF